MLYISVTGSSQSSSVKQLSVNERSGNSQSDSGCEGSHCSVLPGSGQHNSGHVSKCDSTGSEGCGICNDSSVSVIQASTVRKKTNAGLGIKQGRFCAPKS